MQRLIIFTSLLWLGCSPEQSRLIDHPAFSDEAPLPAYETSVERQTERNRHEIQYYNPPPGSVASPAEWEATEGVLVNVPFYNSTVGYYRDLISGIIDGGATPKILVGSSYDADVIEQAILDPEGIRASEVDFVRMTTDAFWTRDYGPWYIFHNGQREIVDMRYYPNRLNDDAVPVRLGDRNGEDVYTAPLYVEGGNFMTDGRGTCWSSDGVVQSNNYSQSAIKDLYRNYLGCSNLTFVEPIPGEGTSHIDMFSKVLNEDTILVAYSYSNIGATQQEIAQLERAAATYQSSPKPGGGNWRIVRIPMSFGYEGSSWSSTRVYYAHTNALILNDTVLVPTYGRGTDSEALRIYREAMPGYRVIGIDSADTIAMGGAVHCTTMQIPAGRQTTCGDSVINGGEQCEGGNLNGKRCATLGFAGGTLSCTNHCTFDTSGCTMAASARCGNNSVEAGEVCDGNRISCTSVDASYVSGTATCRSDCSGFSTSSCVAAQAETVQAGHSDRISSGQQHNFMAITAGPGPFVVTLSMDADADLYVKRGSRPTSSNYDCRPYHGGATTEQCSDTGPGDFYISIHGYDAVTNYELTVEYVP